MNSTFTSHSLDAAAGIVDKGKKAIKFLPFKRFMENTGQKCLQILDQLLHNTSQSFKLLLSCHKLVSTREIRMMMMTCVCLQNYYAYKISTQGLNDAVANIIRDLPTEGNFSNLIDTQGINPSW